MIPIATDDTEDDTGQTADSGESARPELVDGPEGEGSGPRPTPLIEWILGGVGLALMVGVLGFLVYRGFGEEKLPPDIVLEVDTVLNVSGRYLTKIRAQNKGGETVADLLVEAELQADTGIVETSDVSIPFLPSESDRVAGLYFEHDPVLFRIVLRPKAFNEP